MLQRHPSVIKSGHFVSTQNPSVVSNLIQNRSPPGPLWSSPAISLAPFLSYHSPSCTLLPPQRPGQGHCVSCSLFLREQRKWVLLTRMRFLTVEHHVSFWECTGRLGHVKALSHTQLDGPAGFGWVSPLPLLDWELSNSDTHVSDSFVHHDLPLPSLCITQELSKCFMMLLVHEEMALARYRFQSHIHQLFLSCSLDPSHLGPSASEVRVRECDWISTSPCH